MSQKRGATIIVKGFNWTFPSVNAAARAIGISPRRVSRALNGHCSRRNTHGFKFMRLGS